MASTLVELFDYRQKCLTGVEIFQPPVKNQSEQLGEAAKQVRSWSKYFDPKKAEASPSRLGSAIVAKVL
ncbi:hypothetical protein TorRG33x02_224010 [Trema orientale]|uniref:Uncharacterized protein n=1 Tax=Trema orientale TaxID=63057 RepID=A0A2P5E8F5_TREOI|nr:hypothetical protein TorRG33x02_224010 [Trema orientale]